MQETPSKNRPRPLKQPRAPHEASRQTFSFLSNLRVGQKLALISLTLLLPLAVLLFILTNEQRSNISFAQSELIGSQFLAETSQVLLTAQDHHTATDSSLGGDTVASQLRQKYQAQIDVSLNKLQSIDQKYGSLLKTSETLKKVTSSWQEIKTTSTTISEEQRKQLYDRFIVEELFALIDAAGNNSNITLDPEQTSYYVGTLLTNFLPDFSQSLKTLQHIGNEAYESNFGKALPLADRFEFQSSKNTAEIFLDETLRSIQFAIQSQPDLASSLGALGNKLEPASKDLTSTIKQHFIEAPKLSLDKQSFSETTSKPLATVSELFTQSHSLFDQLIQQRINRLRTAQMFSLGGVGLILVLTFFLIAGIARSITRPLAQLGEASEQLAKGKFDFDLRIDSRDEIGQLAQTFQSTSSQLKEVANQEEAERQRNKKLQANVSRFLNVATEIAQGDFTKRGEVTEDVLGNVVDAINLMTEEMAFLLKDVQKAALSVNQSAEQMNQLTDSIASGAQVQAEEVSQVRERTQQAAGAIRQMAERANGSVLQAHQTLEAAQAGRSAVSATLSGMNDIRIEIQGISDQVRQLSRRSSEIETISKTLEDFASQTNLLALNASFEAAGAGALGRRFAVIADEIRSLAESSARETARVGTLVQEVQRDINGVVAMAQDGVRQVESGYAVANSAGERLEEISKLAEQAAHVAEQISSLAATQVSEVEQVNVAVQSIAQTAVSTEQESLQGRQAAQDMRQLAENLTGNLSRFRLPN